MSAILSCAACGGEFYAGHICMAMAGPDDLIMTAPLTGGSDAVVIKPIPGNTDSGDERDDR